MTIFDPATPSYGEPQAIPVVGENLRILAARMGKITQAMVLVSSVVHDQYGLMNQLVDHASQTLGYVYQLEYAPERATSADVLRIETGLRHIVDLCDLCHAGNLMSDMNHQIIMGEVKQTMQFVQEKLTAYCIGQVQYPLRVPQISSGTPQVSLEQYFAGVTPEDRKTTTQIVPETVPSHPPVMPAEVNRSVTVPEHSNIHQVVHKPVQRLPERSGAVKLFSGEDKKERRDAIMKTIRSKGQVTIKDIAENIRGCSEKTIQRDLQELIQHGVLIREGEKRWAVYKLAMKNV